jgi:hypothetical protein
MRRWRAYRKKAQPGTFMKITDPCSTLRFGFVLIAMAVLAGRQGLARDYLIFESTYLGDGLLEYRLSFPDDRYWDQISACAVQLGEAGEFVEIPVTPEGWTFLTQPPGWRQDSGVAQTTPLQVVYQARARQPGYRAGVCTVAFAPRWREWARPLDTSTNPVTLYANVPCLVPAAPSQADGSPTGIVDRVPGFPELRIENVAISQSGSLALTIDAGPSLPVEIQASEDLHSWTSVGNLAGSTTAVTWVGNAPADAKKPTFFRVVVQRPSAPESGHD